MGVSDSLRAPLDRVGRSTRSTAVISAGDLDGDGFADAIIGFSEASIGRLADGIVAVYRGSGDGIETEPTQVLTGRSQESYFGRSVALGDVNGDGRSDLIVGAPLDDSGAGNAGTIFIFLGQLDGSFSDAPDSVVPGIRASDQMGHSIAVCDVNGDGFQDESEAHRTQRFGLAIMTYAIRAGIIFLGGPEGVSRRPPNWSMASRSTERVSGDPGQTFVSALPSRPETLTTMGSVTSRHRPPIGFLLKVEILEWCKFFEDVCQAMTRNIQIRAG